MGPRKQSRRSWLRPWGALGLALLPLACLSPTLPLPPPSRPDVTPPDASGIATITGLVPGGATALAQNLDSGRIVGEVTSADGKYQLPMPAAIGDQIAIWYREGLIDSGSVQVTIPATSSNLGPLGGASGSGD